MRRTLPWALAAALPLCGQPPRPSLEETLRRLAENVQKFETTLPDFVCDERLTSRRIVDGATKAETVTESLFVGRQPNERRSIFVEDREIQAVNGKPVAKGRRLKGPYFFLGGFSSLLDITFSEKWAPFHNYRVGEPETVAGKELLVVAFDTKDGQTEIKQTVEGKQLASQDTGKAWIDPGSMQVVRLERRSLHLPPAVRSLAVAVDYAPVTLDGKTFWMPKAMRAEQTTNSKSPTQGVCLAEYGNYRKFDVSVGIKY